MTNHKTIPFTKEGYEKIRDEYDKLTSNRPLILERLQKAREMGDLSENGMYKAARMELGDTDRRLRKLTYLVRMGRVHTGKNTGVSGFGSQVTVSEAGKTMTFRLVNKHESNPGEKRISTESPLGKILINKRVGETAVLKLPHVTKSFEIIKID